VSQEAATVKKNLPVTDNEVMFGEDERIISTTNLKGIITSVNDTFVHISGFSRDELIGFNHNVVRHPDMPPLAYENLWHTIKSGKPWIGLVKNRCKNGDYYWVHAYVSPIYEGDVIAGYQSVRYKPSREQIARAETLYARINKNGGKLGLIGNLQFHLNQGSRTFVALVMLPLIAAIAGYLTGRLSLLDTAIMGVADIPLAGVFAFMLNRPFARLRDIGKSIADNELLAFVYSGNGQEAATAEHAMMMLQSKLNTAVGRLHQFSGFLCSAADNAASAARRSDENVQRIESEIEQVATAVNEMSATVEEIANNANSTADKTLSTRSQVDDGNSTLQDAMNEITDLSQHVERTGEVINKLSQDFHNVDSVLRFIEEISEQTNLLALNAAIEAARAGEHGRGFAVVADQVRMLANQTKESTNNIKTLLAALNSDMTSVKGDMDGSRSQMQQVLEKIGHLRKDLDRIQESILTVTEMNTSIASAVHEQHTVMEEVNRNIHNISEVSNLSAQDAKESTKAAMELGENAQALKVLIKQVTS
jgi:aerotaxis receptor